MRASVFALLVLVGAASLPRLASANDSFAEVAASRGHRVTLFEAERQSLAKEDFLAQPRVDQAVQFRRRRRALPGACELLLQHIDTRGVDDDLVRSRRRIAPELVVSKEQQSSEYEEVQQRFAENTFNH